MSNRLHYNPLLEQAESSKFQTIHKRIFRGAFGKDEEFRILCRPELGLILVIETYNYKYLNRNNLYMNWKGPRLAPPFQGWGTAITGPDVDGNYVWMGHTNVIAKKHTLHEGRKVHVGLSQVLTQAKNFLPVWQNTPAMYLQPYTSKSDGFMTQAINGSFDAVDWETINSFPQWARAIFLPSILKKRLTLN